MKCKDCERDLADKSNVDFIECDQADHDGSLLEISVFCICGMQYTGFVSLTQLTPLDGPEVEDESWELIGGMK